MDPYFTRNPGARGDQYGYRPGEDEYTPSAPVLLQNGNKKTGSKSTVNLKWTTPPPTTTTTGYQPPPVYGVGSGGGTGTSIDTTPAVSSSETTPVGRTATTPKGAQGAPRVSMPSLSQPTRLNLLDAMADDSPNYFYPSSYGTSGGGGSEGRVGKTTSGGLPVPSNVVGSGGGGYSSDRPFNPLKDTPKSYGSNGSDPAHTPLGSRDPFAEDEDNSNTVPDPFADSPNRGPSRRRGQTEARTSGGPSRNSGNRSRSGTSPPVLEALSSSPTGLTGTDGGDGADGNTAMEDEWKDWYLANDGYWYKKDAAYFAAMNAVDDPQVHYPPAARGREEGDNSSPYNPLLNDSIPGVGSVASGSFGGAVAQSPVRSPSSAGTVRAAGTLPTSAPGVNTSFVNSSMTSQQQGQPGSPEEAKIRFRKIRDLGKGAFGEVFLAMNVMSGELIAVKQIQIDSGVSSKAIRDAKREVNVMVKLPEHPNCVRYIGFQEKEKYVYIIMEFVSGGSVESLLKMSKKRFLEPTVQQYAFMVLLGLQHLHDHNIVHQDIKGANVLIDPNGIAKIADFGCCKDLSAMHMNSSKTAGSPLFMAPEVCRGAPADTRSDVWSFGCLMLEMSKDDRTPWSGFEKMTIFAVIYAISTATTPPAIPSYLSPVCQDFISRCLKLDPDERATIAELLLHPFFTTAFEDEDCETGLMHDESCDKATEESIMRLDRSGPQRTAEDIDSPPLRGGGGGGDASPIRGQELSKPTQQNDESHYLMQFSLRSTGSNYDEDFTKKPSTNPLKKGKLAGGEGGLGSSLSSSPKVGSAGDGAELSTHGSPLLAVPVDGIPTLVPRGERDPLLTMRREGSEPVIYHSSGGGRVGAGAIGGSPGAEGSTQLALVEYVAHSQRNRKKKGFFAKLADKFRCVSL